MGKFSHHVIGAAGTSFACAILAKSLFHTSYADAAGCFILCGFGGILPDIDSPRSRPAEFVITVSSVLAPVFALQYLDAKNFSPSEILMLVVAMYGLARYGMRELIKRFTVHRGIIHSVPFGIIFSALVFMAYRNTSLDVRQAAAMSALIGYITHLSIDELFSLVDISGRQFTPKRSSGSALKFFSKSPFATILTYFVLLMLVFLCVRSVKLQ